MHPTGGMYLSAVEYLSAGMNLPAGMYLSAVMFMSAGMHLLAVMFMSAGMDLPAGMHLSAVLCLNSSDDGTQEVAQTASVSDSATASDSVTASHCVTASDCATASDRVIADDCVTASSCVTSSGHAPALHRAPANRDAANETGHAVSLPSLVHPLPLVHLQKVERLPAAMLCWAGLPGQLPGMACCWCGLTEADRRRSSPACCTAQGHERCPDHVGPVTCPRQSQHRTAVEDACAQTAVHAPSHTPTHTLEHTQKKTRQGEALCTNRRVMRRETSTNEDQVVVVAKDYLWKTCTLLHTTHILR